MTGGQERPRAWDDAYVVSPRSLAIFRLLFGALLLGLLLPRFQWIAAFPNAFFDPPPGVASLFTGFPPRAYFAAIDVVLIAATVFLIAGRRVTAASIAIGGGLLAGNMWAYSFGKIDHDILLAVLPLFLAAAGWEGRGPARAQPLALFALVIALAMATAAWLKIASGWLDLSASGVLGHSVALAAPDGGSAAWRMSLRLLPAGAWELMDYVTVGFEASFIVVVARASAFRALCVLACFFHVAVAALMRITFLSNIPAYAAFVEWDALARRAGIERAVERVQDRLQQHGDAPLLAVSALLAALYLTWGNPVRVAMGLLRPEYEQAPRMVATWIAAITAIVLVLTRLADRRRNPRA